MSKTIYTKLILRDGELVDLPADSTERHELVRVEHPLLAKPLIVAAYMTPEALPWKEAIAAAEQQQVYGLAMRAPTVEEAFFFCDRSQYPALPVAFFPDAGDDEKRWTWTSTIDAESPSGCAWSVYLHDGYAYWSYQDYHYHVRAVRASQ